MFAVPLQRKYSRLRGFALLTRQTYLMYHKQISKNDDDISKYQAKDDDAAALWQRFLRCLMKVDTDLGFLDELKYTKELAVLEACLVSDVHDSIPTKTVKQFFEWAIDNEDTNIFQMMLKVAQKKIEHNTIQVAMPKLYYNGSDPVAIGSTGTLLMALCVSKYESSTQKLRAFLSTFPKEIDLVANNFSVIVLWVSIVCKALLPRNQSNDAPDDASDDALDDALGYASDYASDDASDDDSEDASNDARDDASDDWYTNVQDADDEQNVYVPLVPVTNMKIIYDYFKVKGEIGDLTFLDDEGNTALHHFTNCAQFDDFKTVATSVGQHINVNIANKDKDTVAILAAKPKDDKLMAIHEAFGDRYDPNIQDATGHTCLMYAVLNQSPDVIRALLRHPAIDLTIKNAYDRISQTSS